MNKHFYPPLHNNVGFFVVDFFFLRALILLRHNLHSMKYTDPKPPVWWILTTAHSQVSQDIEHFCHLRKIQHAPSPQLTATIIVLSLTVCTLLFLEVDSSFSAPPLFFFCLTEMYCLRVLEARVWNPGTLRVGSFWGLWGIVRENQFHASLPGSGALRCSLAGRWHPPYSSTSFAQHVSEFFHGLVCISSPFLFYCWVAFYCLDSP